MEKLLPSHFKKIDLIIPAAALVLVLLGLSTIASTVIAKSGENPILTNGLLNTQIFAVISGLMVFAVTIYFNYRYLIYLSPFIYLSVIALLIAVFFLGSNVRGSVRWFELGPINFQPSTLGTVLLGVVFSAYFAKIGQQINRPHYLLLAVLIFLVPLGLMLSQPDLGTAIILAIIWFGLLHLTPIRWYYLVAIYLVLLLVIPFGWRNLADYQRDRVISFINPTQDPLGTGYQSRQALIAVGSGELFGRGWGRGTQSHLQFLPEQHTDFIFATYAEEQGFLGGLIVIALFTTIVWRLTNNMFLSKDYFGQLLVFNVIVWVSLHVLINIGMNIGLAPITGIPLPFISYGGTSLITGFLALGLSESVYVHKTNW